MKKNLRIVSAAAAALLAVAPVAATAVVSAPTATVSAAVKAAENGKGDYVVGSVDTYKRNEKTNTFTAKTVNALKGATHDNPIAVTFVQTVKSGVHNYNQYKLSNGDKFWAIEGDNGAVAGIASVVGSVKDGNISITLPEIKKAESVANYKVDVLDAIAGNQIPELDGRQSRMPEVSVTKNGFPLADTDEVKPGENYNVTLKFSYEKDLDKNYVYALVNGKVVNFGRLGESPAVTYKVNANNGSTTPAKPAKPAVPAKPAKPAVKDNGSSTSVNAGASSIFRADANTAVNLTAVAKTNVAPSTLTGNIVATLDGKQVTASLHNSADSKNVHVYTYKKGERVNANKMTAGHYWAAFENVTVNAGASYAGKTETFTLNKGTFSSISVTTPGATNEGASLTRTADSNGVFHLGPVLVDFYAYNANDLKEVHFYDATTGNVVTSGSVNLHAVNGKLNVSAVYSALAGKYVASQLLNGQGVDQLLPLNDFRDQLKKQNITVDDNGNFTAPASFNLTFNAKSNDNGATASLPVTVTVDNVTPAASQETTKTVKIMHIATIYDKNGKATHEPALRAYNTVSVVSDPVSLKDEKGNDAGKFYKLAGKDQYIKVGNVDGTSRSLKHNSYVYKSTGKRNGKKVLKKGSSVTTYGKSFMIAGHQMYRIGKNQYVKKANF